MTESFEKDDNGDIDTDSFILKGVDSLDKITEDNIVYVYVGGGYITKVEVGTEVVSGEITRTSFNNDYTKSYITIDGTQYKFATNAADDDQNKLAAGNDVTLYLDYDGKIYDSELTAGTTGNYAVVLDATTYNDGALASDTKVQLLTADGVKVFVVDTDKVDANEYQAFYNGGVKEGNVIKFSLNTSDEIKGVTDVVETLETNAASTTKVTAKGYLANMPVLDGAVVFAAPLELNDEFNFDESDDLSVLNKSDVLNKTVGKVYTYVKNDKDEIEFLLVSNSATSEDLYGVIVDTWSTSDGTAASYYVGNELVEECEVDADSDLTDLSVLKKITKNADGTVKFTDATVAGNAEKATSVSGNKVVVNGTTYYLADEAQVYIYDDSDDEFTTDGSALDMIDDETTDVIVYKTAKADSDNAGLVTYVVVTKK